MTALTTLHLTKHHALGNDFLVLLDPDDKVDFGLEMARSLCDRHRGIGADGMIHARTGAAPADITMTLRNADGGLAEMSGNGIRSLAQAVVDAGKGPQLTIATGGGLREVTVEDETEPGVRRVSVDMGRATLGPDQPQECLGRRVRTVDMGNPHLVLLGPDPREVDVADLGPKMEELTPAGINVEFVMLGPGRDELTLRVWERGVGETLACGTGACAAAAAAHSWGLVGSIVTVHQPGGAADIELRDNTVVLSGPTQLIARIEVDWA
ncbi:MAG TPA: diaminopimelate epimerase [Acidimicrobiales bacterium]|nr:diaminopimelate epimerase [Acidimicrobiales bacterium]